MKKKFCVTFRKYKMIFDEKGIFERQDLQEPEEEIVVARNAGKAEVAICRKYGREFSGVLIDSVKECYDPEGYYGE